MSEVFRIRGEEVQVRLILNNKLIATLTEIVSSQVTFKFDKLIEQFLGKSSDSIDEIFRHVDLTLNFQPRSQESLVLVQGIQERATRRVAQNAYVINYAATLQFPNGQRPKILIPDLKFGDVPLNFGGRDKYVDQTFDCSSESFKLAL